MSYREFNIWAYEYYLENLIPNTVNSLTIPSSEIEFFLDSNNEDISSWIEVNDNSWYYLSKNDHNGIPRFFGLIALQCHAAFKMHNDGVVSAANYRNRFSELIGITREIKLNQLFGEKHNAVLNMQEYVWMLAAKFFLNQRIFIEIPTPKSHARRNTQYPESQSIINYEDLREYLILFEHINLKFEVIHFDEFCQEYSIMLPRLRYGFSRKNNIKTISDSENKIKLKQIFDHYVSDEWKKHIRNNKIKEIHSFTTYYLKDYTNGIKLFDENFEEVTDIDKNLKNCKIYIFREDSINKDEYNLVKKIELGSKYIFLIDSTQLKAISQDDFKENFLSKNFISITKKISCYFADLNRNIPEFLSKYVGTEYPLELRGYKLSQKRQYLIINPPKITTKRTVSYSLYLENKRLKENQPTESGKYTIKVNGFSNYTFEIIDIPKHLSNINQSNLFLSFDSLKYTNEVDGDMSGLFIKNKKNSEDVSLTISKWIEIQNKKKYKSSNIIIKALNQSKHGKSK